MKNKKLICTLTVKLLLILSLNACTVREKTLQDHEIKDIGGAPISLQDYKGKTLLIVNIATKCGYTPQLKGLEALYQKYKDLGLVVLGVPSNDFGGQTPENADGVKKFCLLNYGVTFPLTSKTVVKGESKHPLIQALVSQSDAKNEIKWNFEKFLINKKGKLVARYGSKVTPNDPNFLDKVQSVL